MKKIVLCTFIGLASFTSNLYAMTQEQCKPQAMTVYTVLGMIKDGTIPTNTEQLNELKKAVAFIEKGDFCSARNIILNSNKQ